jgi:SHS2 domain-containing protein
MSSDVIDVTWPVLPQRENYASQRTATPRAAPAPTAVVHAAAVGDAAAQTGGFEYLDHTADVQIHSWGPDLGAAFAAAAVGMFGYMVELDEFGRELQRTVTATGHDWESLLFNWLDECLYIFHTEALVMSWIAVTKIDADSWTLTAEVRGGLFDASRDKQGTEVKAITYSNIQIIPPDSGATRDEPAARRAQVYVIVDI